MIRLLFLISNFHHVVNVVFVLLGDSPASDAGEERILFDYCCSELCQPSWLGSDLVFLQVLVCSYVGSFVYA